MLWCTLILHTLDNPARGRISFDLNLIIKTTKKSSVQAYMTKKPNVNEENSPIKRFRYEEGYGKNAPKATSVYNTLIIAIYPTSKESYPIIKEILEKLEIGGIEYLFSQDIKVNTPKLVYGKKYIQ